MKGGIPLPKMELERRSKNRTQKYKKNKIKKIQKWKKNFKDILIRLYNILYPFFVKDVVIELTVKLEYILHSENKNTTIRQKETKFNKKNKSINAIILRRRCINYSQKWKILYLSIDWLSIMIFQYDKNCIYKFDISNFEHIRI